MSATRFDVPSVFLPDIIDGHARNAPEKIALACADATLTWAAFTQAVTGFARWLQARGVGRNLFDAVQGALHDQGRTSLVVWVLASNPNRAFYERMGGRIVSRQPIRLGGAPVQEVAYGWDG